jgi:plasmid stabilization system protein ParE
MTYRVELTARAGRNLKRIFRHINAESSPLASVWFNELEAAILSLDEHPERSPASQRILRCGT